MSSKRRQRKSKAAAKRREGLKHFARKLNENLPKSEQWFNAHWPRLPYERSNVPFGFYIPDIINRKWKYIIEVDGSFHTRADQIKRDAKKDAFYKMNGYAVYRVIHGNLDTLYAAKADVLALMDARPEGIQRRTSRVNAEMRKRQYKWGSVRYLQDTHVRSRQEKRADKQEEFSEAVAAVDLKKKLPF